MRLLSRPVVHKTRVSRPRQSIVVERVYIVFEFFTIPVRVSESRDRLETSPIYAKKYNVTVNGTSRRREALVKSKSEHDDEFIYLAMCVYLCRCLMVYIRAKRTNVTVSHKRRRCDAIYYD